MDVKRLIEEIRPRFRLKSYHFSMPSVPSPQDRSPEKVKGQAAVDGSSIEWEELFRSQYITGHSQERDDLLFYVKYDLKEKGDVLEVARKGTPATTTSSPFPVLWDKTLYLNMILHEFEYHLTCSAITFHPDTDKVDQILMEISQQVFPSPNKRRMDKKKGNCDISYPDIIFYLDNFEEALSSFHVGKPGQKVAIQLSAVNEQCCLKQVVFLGAVDYSTLLEACKRKKNQSTSIGSKLKQLSRPKRRVHTSDPPYQFFRVSDPTQKGFAELAVRKVALPPPHDETQASSHEDLTLGQDTPTMQGVPGTTGGGGSGGGQKFKYSPQLRHVLKLDPPGEEMMLEASAQERGGGEDGGDRHGTSGSRCRGNLESEQTSRVDCDGTDDGSRCHGNPEPLEQNGVDYDGTDDGSRNRGNKVSHEVVNDAEGLEQDEALKATRSLSRIVKRKSTSGSVSPLIHAFLTHVRLPWYSLLEDILNSTQKPVF